jgi:type I restriction enzyme S subunit
LPSIPPHWAWATLGEIAEVKLGKMLSPKAFAPDLRQLPYLRNENVRWFSIDKSDVKQMGFKESEFDRYAVRAGDLLVCEGGEPGRCSVVENGSTRFMFQKALHRVRPFADAVGTRFLQYFFRNFIDSETVIERRSETTIKHLPREKMIRVPVPIPPSKEQRRIVEEIEEQFTRLDAGVAALKRVEANLRRYKAAVLKAAVEGRLTERWRAEHPDVEPASELLKRILTERRRRWEQSELAKKQAKSKPPTDDRWKKKYHEPTGPDTDALPPLPNRWTWATVGQLAESMKNGIYKPADCYADSGTPCLRMYNIDEGRIVWKDVKMMTLSSEEVSEYALEPGDLLVNRVNSRELVGKAAVIPAEFPACVFESKNIRLRLVSPLVEPSFVGYRFAAAGPLYFHSNAQQVVGMASISQPQVAGLPVLLPPLAEQRAIVTEVEERLSSLVASQEAVTTGLRRASRLRQSILKRAFEGRLVPQDPTDEPTSVLLDRIRSERAKVSVRPGRQGGRKARKTSPNPDSATMLQKGH